MLAGAVAALARLAIEGEAVETQATPFGQKYEVRGEPHRSGRAHGDGRFRLDGAHGRGSCAIRHGIPGEQTMRFRLLDTVVLDRDLPERGLHKGDLGAMVQTYEPDGLEVEFVTASGRTEALVTLRESDVRAVADRDLIAVRPFDRSA
jgi:hypothetical protein